MTEEFRIDNTSLDEVTLQKLEKHPIGVQLSLLSNAGDSANDNKDVLTLSKIVEWSVKLRENYTENRHLAYSYYIEGNAWSSLLSNTPSYTQWEWNNAPLEKSILCLRYAVRWIDDSLPLELQSRIHCNLGNVLSHIGRTCEAIACFDTSLKAVNEFGMARMNKAIALDYYSKLFEYDSSVFAMLTKHSYDNFVAALRSPLEQHYKKYCESRVSFFEKTYGKEKINNVYFFEHRFDGGKEERSYRRWCSGNCLFLNPLNDISNEPIIWSDPLYFDNITGLEEREKNYQEIMSSVALLSTIKQEFVSARYLLYESLHGEEDHFSDYKVHLLIDSDFRPYGLKIEKLKMAFRMTYSIFDRIAIFINHYFKLGLNIKGIDFFKVWYENGDYRQGLSKSLQRENNPLRGLYWISRDLFHNDSEFRASLNPDAEALKEIRNCLEHRFLKVVYSKFDSEDKNVQKLNFLFFDPVASTVKLSSFRNSALHLLSLVRSAIILLFASIDVEEKNRSQNRAPETFLLNIPGMGHKSPS